MTRLLFFLIVFYSFSLSAQQCRVPVTQVVFQEKFNQIAILRGDEAKQPKAEQFVAANCVSSQQLKTLAQLFTSDSIRYIVCLKAHPRVTDPESFYVVYDAFATFSYALRLYDAIPPHSGVQASGPVVISNPGTTTATVSSAVTLPAYPAWVYPDTARTTSSRGCVGPVISEHEFTVVATNVYKQTTEEAKIVAIENAMNTNCMSIAQHMKLASFLNKEDNRMRVMKAGFPRVYDQEHYAEAGSMFSVAANKVTWDNFCAAYLIPPCAVSASDFNGLMEQIRAKSFDDDQLALVKLLAKDRCFNVEQLKTISNEFAFDEEKMEIFKLCYATCPDKKNYYQLVDKLTFSANKEDLKKFINAGGK